MVGWKIFIHYWLMHNNLLTNSDCVLDEKFDLEIQTAFSIDQTNQAPGDDTLKKLFKNHKKLTKQNMGCVIPKVPYRA